MTFADYMEQALYGPVGYYSTGTAKSGKVGDYFTAPDVGKAFGALLAVTFLDWKQKMAASDFTVMEAGAGEGRLAQDILSQHPFPYAAVEVSPARRAILAQIAKTNPNLHIVPNVALANPFQGVLFGNELIDAFAVHRVQSKKGKLQELFFDETKRKFSWNTPSTPLLEAYFDRLRITLPDKYETEVNLRMRHWLKEAARVLQKGLLLLIDYGRPAHDYYAPERTRGTLRAFSKHKVSADFLDPGSMVDLTADVDFTSLALDGEEAGFKPLAYMELGSFLLQALEKAGDIAKTIKPAQLKFLIHPEGLGAAFHVLILGKNLDAADWPFEHNRLARLGLPA